MTTPAGTYFDGDYSVPVQHGPVVPWMDPTTRSMLFAVTYHQSVGYWRALAWSTRGPENSYLVDESAPRASDVAGVVEWTRTYAHVPPSRFEWEEHLYNQQETQAGYNVDIINVQVVIPSRVRYDYFHTLTPETIPLLTAPRVIQARGVSFEVGRPQIQAGVPQPAGWVVADNSAFRRWKGNIYERATREVKRLPFKQFVGA